MGNKTSLTISAKTLVACSLLTLFSCSIPFFGKGKTSAHDSTQRSSKLSGMIEFHDDCQAGYYKVSLKGLFENADVQVETQTDSTGHFSLTAPPGKYLASVSRGDCGTKESIALENNTEHMLAFAVSETKAIEKVTQETHQFPSRLPASVLVLPSR